MVESWLRSGVMRSSIAKIKVSKFGVVVIYESFFQIQKSSRMRPIRMLQNTQVLTQSAGVERRGYVSEPKNFEILIDTSCGTNLQTGTDRKNTRNSM
mmetsp:Transcript_53051/g.139857  ORF Transcript_53051/g.139857 Transcript_53051/m.139857 type:complete len:97 (+) Transcript_53051:1245-1535(+)